MKGLKAIFKRSLAALSLILFSSMALNWGCSKPEGSCVTKEDCKGNANCVNGKCVGAGGECATDQDCAALNKASCNNGKCVGCLNDDGCPKDKRCVNNTCLKGCQEDKDCEYMGKNNAGQPAQCLLNNCVFTCAAHTDCPKGHYCKSRVCVEGKAPASKKADELETCGDIGIDCENDGDCKKGTCYKGTCYVECLDGLVCKSWTGGSTSYCFKPCSNGCGKKICVEAQYFAENTSVCMTPIKKQGAPFSYSEGTFCDTKNGLYPIQPAKGQPGFGSGRCWVICDLKKPSCEKGRLCVPLPGVATADGKPVGACLKPCKQTSDCEGIEGLVCKPNIPDCKSDEDCGQQGKCVNNQCESKDFCLPR